jgi:hypothetical protein
LQEKRKEYLKEKLTSFLFVDAKEKERERKERQAYVFRNWINFQLGSSSSLPRVENIYTDLDGISSFSLSLPLSPLTLWITLPPTLPPSPSPIITPLSIY